MCTGKEWYGTDYPRPINRYFPGEGKRGEANGPFLQLIEYNGLLSSIRGAAVG